MNKGLPGITEPLTRLGTLTKFGTPTLSLLRRVEKFVTVGMPQPISGMIYLSAYRAYATQTDYFVALMSDMHQKQANDRIFDPAKP